jgi:NADH-quinone oxidoreductase subunit A
MIFELTTVLVFLAVGAGFVFAALVAGLFFRPKAPTAEKLSTYECGERPIGQAWFNFNPRFYLIAITFLIFDVEIALAYPVATVFRSWVQDPDNPGRGVLALVELLVFVGVLVVGLIFVWGKGNLEWIRELKEPQDSD